MKNTTEFPAQKIGYFLAALLFLFFFRVAAQVIQYMTPVTWLPSFNQWQSGALPYPILLSFQVVILIWGASTVRNIINRKLQASSVKATILLVIGGVYFLTMLFRLLAGQTFASGYFWLDALLPTLFHIVLAAFLLMLSLYHKQSLLPTVQWASYPLIIVLGLLLHVVLSGNEVELLVATYTPVFIAALLINLLEQSFPNQPHWQPTKKDWLNDFIFMALIQSLLPRVLGFLLVISLAQSISIEGLYTYWPHHWSVFSQFVLMLVGADFLRYWLHRLSHNWTPLWRLHAVHHSPHKLYWMNVGRFHPIEKTIQYLFDAMPFILLGVAEPVLALYFVFYAINGFFQHCNINLRLGMLNYLVSGPELHRWHHSRLISESNNNYGNNLIIWDLLFGSWHLPANQHVKELGLVNRDYPMDFKSQMLGPFKGKLDKIE
jgi:sterol desaturase/sphingolipid hydroxylase (fatty acid hydroxylase superfamily)